MPSQKGTDISKLLKKKVSFQESYESDVAGSQEAMSQRDQAAQAAQAAQASQRELAGHSGHSGHSGHIAQAAAGRAPAGFGSVASAASAANQTVQEKFGWVDKIKNDPVILNTILNFTLVFLFTNRKFTMFFLRKLPIGAVKDNSITIIGNLLLAGVSAILICLINKFI